jgi:hypothetical protein
VAGGLHAARRPDYKKLGVLKQLFPDVPILALTATATERVRADICSILRLSGCETFQSSIDRPNLFYEARSQLTTSTALLCCTPHTIDVLVTPSPSRPMPVFAVAWQSLKSKGRHCILACTSCALACFFAGPAQARKR